MVCLSAYEILYHIYKSIEMKINLDLCVQSGFVGEYEDEQIGRKQ